MDSSKNLFVYSLVGGIIGALIVISSIYLLPFNVQQASESKVVYVNGSAESVIEGAYASAAPSVVHITSTVLTRDFFFRIVPSQGTGSGIIISEDGLIVTNNHVIKDANKIDVKMPDGKSYRARLLGASATNDIALLKIEARGLPSAVLGDSDSLRIGGIVIAIGNPFGLDRTATTGIVSALNRTIESDDLSVMEGLIQTDASINPGNSGGPLVNAKGEIVGINTAIFSTSGGSIGIGFAIPINKVKVVIKDIQEGREKENGAWLGVTAITVDSYLSETLNLPVAEGAMIVEVLQGSPADTAGLKGGTTEIIIDGKLYTVGGDIVTEISGTPVKKVEDLVNTVKSKKPGDTIKLVYTRKKIQANVTITLGQK